MTALRVHPGPTLASAGSAWVCLDEAARLLGKSEGQLRRLCQQLEPRGMARKHKIVVGNTTRVVWQVAASYSPRLVRAAVEVTESGTSIVNELLAGTSAEQRAAAETRFAILKAFRAAKGRDGFNLKAFRARMTVEHGSCPGRRQLYQWHADCPPSTDAAGCIAALVDRRGRPAGTVESCSDAAWAAFAGMYLDRRLWSVAKCHRATAELARQNGWAWPSYRYVCQLVDQRIDPSTACLAREGQDAWNRKFKAPLQQNPDAYAPGECWESDHVVLDFEVRIEGGPKNDGWVRTRPQLTTWFDRRTRRVMGWEISRQGNEGTIRRALLNALRDPEVSRPDRVVIDNGKDFAARSIGGVTKQARRRLTGDEQREVEATATGLLNILHIEAHFAQPYNHDGKARIERWHRFIHEDFDCEFASYVGNSPGMVDRRDRPEGARDVMDLPTLADVRARFADWVEWYNNRSDHRIDDLLDPETRERLSPAAFYDRHRTSRDVVRDPAALYLLEQVVSTPLKVSKKGIGFKIAGKVVHYGEHAPFLEQLVGSEDRVYVGFDPEDITSVRVWDADFRLLGIADMNGYYGGETVSKADLKAGLKNQRDQKRRVKERIDMIALTAQPAELAARARRDADVGREKARQKELDRSSDPRDLPNLRIVGTKLDGQADQVKRAEQRKAAGSEYDAPPNMPSLIDAVASFHQPSDRGPADPFAVLGGFESQSRPPVGSPYSASTEAEPFAFQPPPPPPPDDGLADIRLPDLFS